MNQSYKSLMYQAIKQYSPKTMFPKPIMSYYGAGSAYLNSSFYPELLEATAPRITHRNNIPITPRPANQVQVNNPSLADAMGISNKTGFGIFNKVKSYSVTGTDVRIGSGSESIKLPVRQLRDSKLGASLIDIGGRTFSYPAWKLTAGTGDTYSAVHATTNLYSKMGAASSFSGMKSASRKFKDFSRSVLGSSLGVDWSIALHRSHMIDIGEFKLGFEYGDKRQSGIKTVDQHLEHLRGLFSKYSRSGGFGIDDKDKAIFQYYSGLVNALEGRTINIDGQKRNIYVSSVKDMLFRGHSYASVLSPQDMGFGFGMKDISKSIHGGVKVNPIDIARLKKLRIPFQTPAASATIATKEAEFFNLMGQFNGIKGPSRLAPDYVGRLGVDVGFVLGKGTSLKGIAPHGMSDSAMEGSRKMFRIMSSIDRQNLNRVTRSINIDAAVDPLLHPRLAPIVESLRGGTVPLGMEKLENGFYGFTDRNLYLKRSDMLGYARGEGGAYVKQSVKGAKKYRGIYLGTSTPGYVPTDRGDIFRAAVVHNTEADALRVHGIKVTNGQVSVQFSEYFNPKKRGVQGRIESPVMLNNVRGTMSSTRADLGFHALARAEDFGLKVTDGQIFASPQFITKNVIPHLAHRARKAGKLKEFASFAGLDYTPASGSVGEYVSFNKNTQPGGVWLPQFLKKLTNTTEDLGLGKSAGLIKQTGAGYAIDSSAVRFTKNSAGESVAVLGLHGQELIRRASMYERAKIGRGAFTVRLQETMPILYSQWKGTSNSAVASAYGSIYKHFMSGIKRGTRAFIAGGPSFHVGRQIAGLMMAPFGGGAAPGGLLAGLEHKGPTLTLEQWYRSAKAGVHRPLAESGKLAEEIMSQGAISGERLANTVHSLSSGLPIMLRLPKAIQSATKIGQDSQYINQSAIFFPSDVLLGTGPTSGGVVFGRSSGIKSLGLARQKATIFSTLFQEMKIWEAKGGHLSKYVPSEQLSGLMSGFATQSRQALIGKFGTLYHNLAYRPKGALYSPVSAMSGLGLDDPGVVGVHVEHFTKLLRRAGYSHKEIARLAKSGDGVYGMYARHPIHSEGNLQFNRIVALSGAHVDRNRIYASRRGQYIQFGDFDHDTGALVVERSKQREMKLIHEHHSRLMEIYSSAMDEADRKSLEVAKAKMFDGFTITDLLNTPEEERVKLVESIAARYRGAAGGGASVGAVDMFYRRLTSLGRHVSQSDSAFITTLKDLEHNTGTKAALMASDNNFIKYLSTLQEVGVYGILKKGATGFGSEDLSVVQGLAEYGAKPTLDNLSKLRTSLAEGIQKQFKEGNFKIGPQTEALGITAEEFSRGELSTGSLNKVLDLVLGESAGHGGVATLARIRQVLKNAGEIDPYEDLFRGQFITTPELLNKKTAGLAPHLVGASYDTLEAAEPAGYVQSNEAVNKSVLSLTAAANDAVKSNAARKSNRGAVAGEGATTIGSRAVAGVTSFIKETKELTNTAWGNKILLGLGAVAALGAADAIFGRDDSEENPAPTFVPTGGSPLPPMPRLGPPDNGVAGPSANVIRNRHAYFGRIERPASTRQSYDISAVTDAGSDFGTSMGAYMGSGRNRPTHSSYVIDRRSNRRDSTYQTRRQLQSSF